MKDRSKEFLVGCLVLLVIGLLAVFAWLMGVLGPLRPEINYHITYGFAGGVEIGSPVRVSGVKVGRVEEISFLPQPGENGATLDVTINVSRTAARAVRKDSKFYVNMAGIIGERYIEISPGTSDAPPLPSGSHVRGTDPPRIDQLLSQGYGLFGRVQEFLDENEPVVTDFLTQTTHLLKGANGLLKDANTLLRSSDRRRFFTLVDNLNEITGDLKSVTKNLQSEENRRFLSQLRDLVGRAHSIDHATLKKFFQEEGIRARIF